MGTFGISKSPPSSLGKFLVPTKEVNELLFVPWKWILLRVFSCKTLRTISATHPWLNELIKWIYYRGSWENIVPTSWPELFLWLFWNFNFLLHNLLFLPVCWTSLFLFYFFFGTDLNYIRYKLHFPQLTKRKGLKMAKTMLNINGWFTMWIPFRRAGKHLCTHSATLAAKLGVKYVTWLNENPSMFRSTCTPAIWSNE